MTTTKITRRAVLVGGSVATLGACALPGGGDPPQLYTLTPKSTFAADLPQADWQLAIELPIASGGLDTARIALQRTPFTLDFYARAAWTDTAPRMVQALLIESFEATGKIVGVSRDSAALRPDYLLKVDLREFQAEYFDGALPHAHVRLGVRLVRLPDRVIEAGFVADERVRAAQGDLSAVSQAFDAALGSAMRKIVEWTLRAGQPRRRR
ncbi:MAG: membrane integrity-associated transporter subunit PqiC [Alphaproteobacteria bacterium]|nr:membrane integrity-associated transporter subunit PqiC [Alphaproteobacteria bacterium]